MGKLYTSRYSNKDLQHTDALKVGISAGLPRFPLKYELTANLTQLAPGRAIFRMTDKAAFRRKYFEQLDRLGIAMVEQLIKSVWRGNGEKDLILLCYEDVTCDDNSKNWCHRTYLAEWLRERLGYEVEEYPDSGCYAAKHKEEPKEDDGFEQMLLF